MKNIKPITKSFSKAWDKRTKAGKKKSKKKMKQHGNRKFRHVTKLAIAEEDYDLIGLKGKLLVSSWDVI